MVWLKLAPAERRGTLAAAAWWEASLLPPEGPRSLALGSRGAAWLRQHDRKCEAPGFATVQDKGGVAGRPP